MVFTSDFRRARETAELIHAHFSPHLPLQLEVHLRERFFGDLELKQTKLAIPIVEKDPVDPSHTMFNSESVLSVFQRMSECIRARTEENPGKIVIFVSHMDPINILLTRFEGKTPAMHTTLPIFGNAELRELDAPLDRLRGTEQARQS